MFDGELPDLCEPASAADEEKCDLPICSQLLCGFQDGIQRMTRTVVAGVHDYEFVGQPVEFPKSGPSRRVKSNIGILRPWRQHGDFFGSNPFRDNAVAHEPVESDDSRGLSQTETRNGIENFRGQRIRPEPSGGDCFVGDPDRWRHMP